MEPLLPAAAARGMAQQAAGLAHLDHWAPPPPERPNGNSSQVEALFRTVSSLDVPVARGRPVRDCLEKPVYHALVASFLASEASPAPTSIDGAGGGQPPPPPRPPIDDLRATLARYNGTLPWRPLDIDILKLCYSVWAPATLLSHGPTLYVACRGSKTLPEFKLDRDARLKPIDRAGLVGYGSAHGGILRACQAQREEVLSSIDGALVAAGGRLTGVVFCGHSLGGAVAQLLALAYAQRQRRLPAAPPATVVSFGCPRLGTLGLHNQLGRWIRHVRLYVAGDPIPGVPRTLARILFRTADVHLYTAHAAAASWKLDKRAAAAPAGEHEPTERINPLAVRDCFRRHLLDSYARALSDHRDVCKTTTAVAAAA